MPGLRERKIETIDKEQLTERVSADLAKRGTSVQKDMVKTRKNDWFYDTKAGRTILLVLAVLLVVLSVVSLVLFFPTKRWYLLFMGVVGVFSGVSNLIILDRKRKELARLEDALSNEKENDR